MRGLRMALALLVASAWITNTAVAERFLIRSVSFAFNKLTGRYDPVVGYDRRGLAVFEGPLSKYRNLNNNWVTKPEQLQTRGAQQSVMQSSVTSGGERRVPRGLELSKIHRLPPSFGIAIGKHQLWR